jgi:hypothetical protein
MHGTENFEIKRQLVAHGDYSSIANWRTKLLAIFRGFSVFRNSYVFVPVFLAEHLKMFCGILFGRHCSRQSHPNIVGFTDQNFPPQYFQYIIRTENVLLFLNIIFISRGLNMAYSDWTESLKIEEWWFDFRQGTDFSLLQNVQNGSGDHPAATDRAIIAWIAYS